MTSWQVTSSIYSGMPVGCPRSIFPCFSLTCSLLHTLSLGACQIGQEDFIILLSDLCWPWQVHPLATPQSIQLTVRCVCVCVMINMACGSHDVDNQVMSWSVKTPHSFTINIVLCYFPFLLPQQTTYISCIIIFTIWQGLPLLFYLMGEQPNHRPAEQPHSNTVKFLCFLPSWKIL